MTLVLSEKDVESLLEMNEVVACLEEAFRRQSQGEAVNTVRTRSIGAGGTLSVMHASLGYLGRGGLKCYVSSNRGTRFVFILFDSADSMPLAVMGADVLGRFRTGATSGVATKYLYGQGSATLALCGSGKQALTQVLAVGAVTSISAVRVWSPQKAHREEFTAKLRGMGLDASEFDSAAEAISKADVLSAITSSKKPFLTSEAVAGVSHVNICGSNSPERTEIEADAVSSFGTVVVDDLEQAKIEYGDLIQAVDKGTFSWEDALELREVVAGKVQRKGKTLFKSGGIALEDVSIGSMVYDKAVKSGGFAEFDLSGGRA